MIALFAKFKAYSYAIGAAILAFAVLILRNMALKGQRDRAIEGKRREKARADQSEKVIASELEINNEFSDLEREAKRDVQSGKMPDSIRNRNQF